MSTRGGYKSKGRVATFGNDDLEKKNEEIKAAEKRLSQLKKQEADAKQREKVAREKADTAALLAKETEKLAQQAKEIKNLQSAQFEAEDRKKREYIESVQARQADSEKKAVLDRLKKIGDPNESHPLTDEVYAGCGSEPHYETIVDARNSSLRNDMYGGFYGTPYVAVPHVAVPDARPLSKKFEELSLKKEEGAASSTFSSVMGIAKSFTEGEGMISASLDIKGQRNFVNERGIHCVENFTYGVSMKKKTHEEHNEMKTTVSKIRGRAKNMLATLQEMVGGHTSLAIFFDKMKMLREMSLIKKLCEAVDGVRDESTSPKIIEEMFLVGMKEVEGCFVLARVVIEMFAKEIKDDGLSGAVRDIAALYAFSATNYARYYSNSIQDSNEKKVQEVYAKSFEIEKKYSDIASFYHAVDW